VSVNSKNTKKIKRFLHLASRMQIYTEKINRDNLSLYMGPSTKIALNASLLFLYYYYFLKLYDRSSRK